MDGPTTHQRRGDLDALRAFAMLLGIVLHASTAAVLLVSYRRWIRPTFLGRLLGGSTPTPRAAGPGGSA